MWARASQLLLLMAAAGLTGCRTLAPQEHLNALPGIAGQLARQQAVTAFDEAMALAAELRFAPAGEKFQQALDHSLRGGDTNGAAEAMFWLGYCREKQQRRDEAVELYRRLYAASADAGSRCDALRRIAEIQCNCTGAWREGLATYRRIVREFPTPPPPAPYPTNRTCGPLNGTHLLDFDLVAFTHARLLAGAKTAAQAAGLREEFARLAPQRDTIRFHTLYQLARRLRRLGGEKRADEIEARLGLCEAWLVVGPFNGCDPPGQAGEQARQVPADLAGLPRLARIWRLLSRPMRSQIRTSYEPETDCLAHRIASTRGYRVASHDGRPGRAMWISPDDAMLHRTWQADGALYALTCVHSPKDQPARLRVAVSGFARAWLNGKSVLATDVLDYPVMDQHVGAIRLRAGTNQLLVKFVPWSRSYRSYVRVTGTSGWSLPGVTCSAPPAPAGNRAKSDFLRPRGATAKKPAEP